MNPSSLSRLSSEDLKRLLRALHRGVLPSPSTRAALIASGFGSVEQHLEAIVGRDGASAQAVVAAVLGERAAARDAHPARLAFTGVATPGTLSRDTVEHVRELMGGALHSLDLVGVTTVDDRRLMRTLGSVIEGRALGVRLVFDVPGPDAALLVRAFLDEHFPRVRPVAYLCSGRRLTARVVVADGARVLVTSAQLAGGEDDGHIDAGVLLDDAPFATSLQAEWQRLIDAGVFVPV